MKISLDCLPCFINQVLGSAKRLGLTEERTLPIVKRVIAEMANFEQYEGTTHFARRIQQILKEETGESDLFAAEKQRANQWMSSLLEERFAEIDNYDFTKAVRLAVAGNIIDLGANPDLTSEDVIKVIDGVENARFFADYSESLKEEINGAENILYIGDNTGEIVFDKLLVSQLPENKVTFVVRGGPVLNDVTMKDADETGMSHIVKVIDTGVDLPGISLDESSEEFLTAWQKADLVIAKGQGNFESLCEYTDKRIFFLFMVKCKKVARMVGGNIGDYMILDNIVI